VYVLAVVTRSSWPTSSPILAHGIPARCNAPVTQVVRRERRNTGCSARARDRRAEALAAEALEDGPLRDAILARYERRDGPEKLQGDPNPPSPPRLSHATGYSPALPRLVDVTPSKRLKLTDAHPGRVEHERREAVAGGEEADDGLDMCSGRRLELAPFIARHLDEQLVAGGIRLNPGVVDHHREHGDCLSDRLLTQAGTVEFGDEVGDRLCVQALEWDVTESRQETAERYAIRLHRSGRDVNA
jgi:hypothetical protein